MRTVRTMEPSENPALDPYVLGTGEAGARRLNLQSDLTDLLSFAHVRKADLKEGSVVYDFGCGTGAMTEHLAKLVGSRGQVFAIDRSDAQLELAKKRITESGLENIKFIQADIVGSELPIFEPADAVYSRLLLMHLRNPEVALRHMVSALKAGGFLLLQEPVNSTNHAEGSNELGPLVQVFMNNGAARGVDYDIGLRIEQLVRDQNIQVVEVSVDHVVMEPDVARQFLIVSFDEWGKAALRDGLIDEAQFTEGCKIASGFKNRFHFAEQYYLTARKS